MARIAACGQTIAHLLHWMQSFSSHVGISMAMFRFSHCAVAVAKVPSTGKAETGRRSPLFASMIAVIFWTKSGASIGTIGGILSFDVAAAGTFTSWRFASVWSTASKFIRTSSAPFLP